MGYELFRFHQALHFTKDNITEGGAGQGLFSGYVENFYKLKKCNSGFPDWCKSSSQRKEYAEKLGRELGCEISPDEFSHNLSIKFLAKLLLNR